MCFAQILISYICLFLGEISQDFLFLVCTFLMNGSHFLFNRYRAFRRAWDMR